MTEYLQFKKSNCKHCYKCIHHCPVKAINFSSDQAIILSDECVLCGNCYSVCPQNAKNIRDDIHHVKEMIRMSRNVIASLAPSYVANYNNASIAAMKDALLSIGFSDVQETALGATIVKNEYNQMVRKAKHKVIISSCCHSINTLIQKHYPQALPYLAKVISPMLAHGQMIKRENPDALTVFIGPCISKKEEAHLYPGMIDCVLTFEELSAWLKEENISIDPSSVQTKGERTRLFPITGGILQSMDVSTIDNYDFIAIDGIENCIAAINDILDSNVENCFIEMSACKGSCISGPAMNVHNVVMSHIAVKRNAGCKDFAVSDYNPVWLRKEFPSIPIPEQNLSSKAIEQVLLKMGKTRPEHELNCGSCGYDTCRKKAAAILMGKAEIAMCLPYLMSKTQSFSDNIITHSPYGILVLSESLKIQQINNAACTLFGLENDQKVLGLEVDFLLPPNHFDEVLELGKNVYEKSFYIDCIRVYITLTIIHDKRNHILIVIIRDITEIEKARKSRHELSSKAVEITDKVIEKQMRTVQEIASLLGETTAETQIALTTLKETLSNE